MHWSQGDNLRQGLDPPLPAWRPRNLGHSLENFPVLQKTLDQYHGVGPPIQQLRF